MRQLNAMRENVQNVRKRQENYMANSKKESRGPFLESPDNVSGPKSHLYQVAIRLF